MNLPDGRGRTWPQTLKGDPERSDHILEPIRLKGVGRIGDHGLVTRAAFASPTVQVAGDEQQFVAAGHAAKMLADQKALAAAGGAGG